MNRIEYLRKKENLYQKDLAKLLNVSIPAINYYEKEKRAIDTKTAEILADFFNVSIDYLLGKADTNVKSNLIELPVVGVVKAGYDYLAIENIIDTIKVETSLVGDGSEYFALKLKGDSMAPAFVDGDIVIVKKQNDCENNEFAIVIINGEEGTLKKVKKTDVGIILQPLNPAYTPLIFTNEEIKNIPIIIVGIVKKLERRF